MIAYYAHQHGSGHCKFASKFAEVIKSDFTIYTSFDYNFQPSVDVVKLPSEDPDQTSSSYNQNEEPSFLHYSPVGQRSIQKRSLRMLAHMVENNCKCLIIDVSVEIAALARACSIPFAYVRLPGYRNDSAHIQTFKSAMFLLSYYPEDIEDERTPQWVRDKTIYLGFLEDVKSKGINSEKIVFRPSACKIITILSGKGGNAKLESSLPRLVERFPASRFRVLGEFENKLEQKNVTYLGYVDNVLDYLNASDLIVYNCGLNTVSEVLRLGIPGLAIAEERPFDEQRYMCKMLYKNNYVLSLDQLINTKEHIELDSIPEKFYDYNAKKRLLNLMLCNFHRLPEIPVKWRSHKTAKKIGHNKKMLNVSVITICYRRQKHLNNLLKGILQNSALPQEIIVVDMDEVEIPEFASGLNIKIVNFSHNNDERLPIAQARNEGALRANHDHLIFLDVDCIPSSNFIESMLTATKKTDGLVMGTPKYLKAEETCIINQQWLSEQSIYHPHRPQNKDLTKCQDFGMFWSLCFCIKNSEFFEIGGFDTDFKGYGGEDTDFSLRWLNDGRTFYLSPAEVYHQQHPIYRPPVNKLDDIVYNCKVFYKKWNIWPMSSWLKEFTELGLLEWEDQKSKIYIKKEPSNQLLEDCLNEKAPFI